MNLNILPAPPEMAKPATPRTGVDRAPDAIFVPTPDDVVKRMLGLAALTPESVLYDLGSGDGRIVIEAARQYGCKAIGYEIDSSLVELSRDHVRSHNLEHRVRIEHADLCTVDLSGADAIMVYLPSPLLDRLRPQFDRLKPGSRIVSHQFPIPGIKPHNTLSFVSSDDGDRHRIYMWKAPLPAPEP